MPDDSDSDEWGMEELVIPAKADHTNAATTDENNGDDGDGDGYWTAEKKEQKDSSSQEETTATSKPKPPKPAEEEGYPMIIVDITQMDATIHSKFDRNSVNDATAASALRKKLESNYERYAKDSNLLADGTVLPCGSTVWRDALVRLRDDRPGHYFAPIFPPKK